MTLNMAGMWSNMAGIWLKWAILGGSTPWGTPWVHPPGYTLHPWLHATTSAVGTRWPQMASGSSSTGWSPQGTSFSSTGWGPSGYLLGSTGRSTYWVPP